MAVVNAQMTDVTLTQAQCSFVRELAFDELKDAAHALADHAHAAAEAAEGTGCIAGDDAYDTAHSRVQAVYELLDTVGWSVLGEPARQEGGE
jgi:hypothetical protein